MLLNMRLKHLIKMDSIEKAAVLAKICSEYPGYEGKGNFKQIYLVCICMTKTQEQLMEEVSDLVILTKHPLKIMFKGNGFFFLHVVWCFCLSTM